MEHVRQDPRREVTFEVHYRTAQEFRAAYAGNISGGGIFIRTQEPPPLNRTVQLRFTLPGVLQSFECQGLVVWANPAPRESLRPAGMGLKFLDLPRQAKQRIEAFVTAPPGGSAPPLP
jgi:uncharacterized protein (TIGR02266 family)